MFGSVPLEVSIYKAYGADEELAKTMSALFRACHVTFIEPIKEIIKQAKYPHTFQYLAFAMLLKGDTEMARHYLKRAIETGAEPLVQTILSNLDKVQEILTKARRDIDAWRRTPLYQREPLESLLV